MADNFDGELVELEREAQERAEQDRRERESKQVEDSITKWDERIKRARKHDDEYHKKWAENRKYAKGESQKQEVTANLISAIVDVLASFLYAKDPDLNIRPSAAITRFRDNTQEQRQRQMVYREFAKTLEVVVSRLLRDAKLKRVAKRWLRGTMTCGPGWLKVVMQTKMQRDPVVEQEINDLRNQLAAIESLQADIKDGESDPEVKAEKLRANMIALQAKMERVIATGLVIDYYHAEDITVATECGEVENYLSAPWICFDSYKGKEATAKIVEWDAETAKQYLKGANRYVKRPRKGESNEPGEGFIQENAMPGGPEDDSEEGFYLIREVWSLDDGVIYTFIDGCKKKWAREPYAPITGQRFYPNFLLGFHYFDGERYPQSDVDQLKSLQEEYNEVRSDFRTHRRRAKPGIIFNEAAVAADHVDKVSKSSTQEIVGVELTGDNIDIRTVFVPKTYNQVDPGLYDTAPIHRDMERMSGAQESLQSSVAVQKTATEARIQDAGFSARTGSRRDELDDVLTEMCEYVAQVALQTMDQAAAMRYAGPSAVWVEMSVEEVMTLFDVEIKAGSTGKPEAAKDREAWGTLLPLIEGTIQKIGAARLAGQEWAAQPWIALLEETLNRLDDHADLDQFLPLPPQAVPQTDDGEAKKTESETKLNDARRVSELADAVEKVPSLALTPIVKQLFNVNDEEEPAAPQPQPEQPTIQ